MELRRERDALLAEQDDLNKLLESPARQRTRLKRDLNALRKEYGPETALGRRRTTIAEAAPTREFSMDAMIEKEPVTVVLSARGWILRGQGPLAARYRVQVQGRRWPGLGAARADHRQAAGRARHRAVLYAGADKLPGARGFGEPIRTMVDIDPDAHIVALVVYRPKGQLLLAANTGRGLPPRWTNCWPKPAKGAAWFRPSPASRSRSCARSRPSTITSPWSAKTASW
jgi:topoisomerase-4 subunit A